MTAAEPGAERILVVDDERPMLRSLERVLSPHHPVSLAASADEALGAARAERPDLAILDVRMPEVDGFELAGRLRELLPDLDVVFMTGAVQELDAQLVRAIRERAFYFVQKPFDREVLLTLVARCLERRRLERANREHLARLRDELADAFRFQRGMLPPSEARHGPVALAARYEPCDRLGGDFYDHASAAGGAALLVADVSGHGVSAAMLTALVKSAFHDAASDACAPGAVVRRVAAALRPFDDDRFVTVFCARVSADGGTLEYANAGHPPPLLWGPRRELVRLERTGPLLSPAYPDLGWDVATVPLARGDRLLVHTDGVVEARGEGGALFGDERLLEHARAATGGPSALLDDLLAAVRAFAGDRPLEDDITLLAAELTAP